MLAGRSLGYDSPKMLNFSAISLSRAYRLSDVGVAALVFFCSCIVIFNINKCSLLRRELYLYDYLQIHSILMISARKKL
ncbi:hypothetical protein SDJN03_16644, partial [Cucurbita argyrosperma subsp. sororia]